MFGRTSGLMRLSARGNIALLEFIKHNHLLALVSVLDWVSSNNLMTSIKNNILCEEGDLLVL